ncbi:helix-turn-helix domain-containing protein [Haloarcula litorea]|uniref:helix-turn-helix domain-containing protein n=1 Tax=Haloarcula litorea TaxID=3032579 RepID=UPI0023E84F20|nr:helix-turn-helix domain-containing protein [Halomicroarcula sp. GDY20]
MKRIQFSVTYDDRFVHPLHRRLVDAAELSRAELLLWSPTGDATTLFWCDGDRGATERVVAGVDSLVAATFVPDRDGTYAFLSQDDYEFAGPILDAVGASDVLFRPPVVFLDTGAVRFEAVGETAALSGFHDDLADLGTLAIERVQAFERAGSPSGLTERQRAALDAAVAVGYYEVPRSGTIADVAAELDCSTSTAGELVRKAESAVVREFAERR